MQPIMTPENKSHSLLSPSSCKRWVSCPPSALINAQAERTTSVYAEEGTLAHAVAEMLLSAVIAGTPIQFPEGTTEEMKKYVQKYTDYVLDFVHPLEYHTEVGIEAKVSLEHLYEDTSGTCDAWVFSGTTLHVFDLKYGQGLAVSAEHNYQLMLYAHGICKNLTSELYCVEKIALHIIQPRLDSISVWETDAKYLNTWFEEVVRPAAALAVVGAGEKAAGDHCKFCAIHARCKAVKTEAIAHLEDIFGAPEKDPTPEETQKKLELLSNDELAEILDKFEFFSTWEKAIRAELHASLLRGGEAKGYMLTQFLGSRTWTDEEEAKKRLGRIFGRKEVVETNLLSVAKIEKKFGKNIWDENKKLAGLVHRPDKGAVLTTYSPKKTPYQQQTPEIIFGEL